MTLSSLLHLPLPLSAHTPTKSMIWKYWCPSSPQKTGYSFGLTEMRGARERRDRGKNIKSPLFLFPAPLSAAWGLGGGGKGCAVEGGTWGWLSHGFSSRQCREPSPTIPYSQRAGDSGLVPPQVNGAVCSHRSECFSDCCHIDLDQGGTFCAPKARIAMACLPQVRL